MNLLLISNENKSHYVYIKDFNRFMYNKTKSKNKKNFCKYCLQYFSSGKILKKTISCFKQLAVPFKIYADFEYLLKGVKISNKKNSSHTEKYQDHIPCSFAYKLFVLTINSVKELFIAEERMQFIYSLKPFMKNSIIVKKL